MNFFPFYSTAEVTLEARNALRATVIYLAAAVAAFLVELYLALQYQAWEMYAVTAIGAILTVVALLSVRYTQYGRFRPAIRLLLAASLLSVLAAPIFIIGFGLILGLGMVLVVLTIASQTLSSKEANLWLVVSVIIAFIAGALDLFVDYLLLDLLNLNSRLNISSFQLFMTTLGGAMIATYAFNVARQFRSFALPTKLILAFICVSLVPLGLLALLNDRSTRIALTDDANKALSAAASQTAAGLDSFVAVNLGNIETESKLPAFLKYLQLPVSRRTGSSEEIEVIAILNALGQRNGQFISSYAVLDAEGRNVIDTSGSAIGQDESGQDYFREPVKSGQPYVSPVQISPATGEAYLYFSSPVQGGLPGTTFGVLRVRYQAAILQYLIERNNELVGEGSFAILLDENHIRLAHGGDPELTFKALTAPEPAEVAAWQAAGRLPNDRPLDELSTDLQGFARGLQQAAVQPHFTTHLATNQRLNSAAVAPLETRPWSVVFVQPQDVFLAPIQSQARTTLFFAIAIASVVVVVAFGVAQVLAAPLLHLTQVVTRFTAGDLEARAEIHSNDEAGVLTHSFNELAEQVGRLLNSLESYNDELEVEIGERKRAEAALQQYQGQLEAQVSTRTAELTAANEQLRQEIIERRRAQAELERAKELAEAANQAKSVFLANMTHELRTPLNAIIGYSEMLQEDASDTGQLEFVPDLKRIWSAGDHLLTIINDLLDLSKIEAGKMNLHPELFEVSSLIEGVAMTAQPLLRRNNTVLQVDCPGNVGMMHADPIKLRQILLNLLSNAAKFTEQGRVTLTVAKAASPQATTGLSEMHFRVRDSGIGISPEQMENIFEPFIQADASTTRKYGGTGLGLAITSRYCQIMGGSISVTSEPGQGSTFTVRLPVAIEDLTPQL